MEINRSVAQEVAAIYRGHQDGEQAVAKLALYHSPQELAKYIVEAFNRGWITRANLGIDEDGNLI